MTTTIALGATSLVPLIVNGYSSERESGNIVHDVLGTGAPSVTFGPAGLRTGTLELIVATMAAALAFEALHTQPGVLHLTDSDVVGVNMYYVTSGKITVAISDERTTWAVKVDFQEVTP